MIHSLLFVIYIILTWLWNITQPDHRYDQISPKITHKTHDMALDLIKPLQSLRHYIIRVIINEADVLLFLFLFWDGLVHLPTVPQLCNFTFRRENIEHKFINPRIHDFLIIFSPEINRKPKDVTSARHGRLYSRSNGEALKNMCCILFIFLLLVLRRTKVLIK